MATSSSSPPSWPDDLPVVQVRVVRPTDQLDAVVRFYRDGVGLTQLGSWEAEGHAGYRGVLLGLPEHAYHLAFIQHAAGSPCPAPSRDNLLVLYIPDRAAIDRIAARLQAMGYDAVPPQNPWWAERGVTIPDPDGWRIVLMNTGGIERPNNPAVGQQG